MDHDPELNIDKLTDLEPDNLALDDAPQGLPVKRYASWNPRSKEKGFGVRSSELTEGIRIPPSESFGGGGKDRGF